MYAGHWIIRFEGTITQGPNAGKSYTFAKSWGGVQFDNEAQARAKADEYRKLEPAIALRILHRCYDEKTGKMTETEVA